MSKNLKITALAAASLTAAIAMNASAAPKNLEKCYGVVKAGKNDCGSLNGSHSCAGQATKDKDPNEWVFVPKGLCDRLAGSKKG